MLVAASAAVGKSVEVDWTVACVLAGIAQARVVVEEVVEACGGGGGGGDEARSAFEGVLLLLLLLLLGSILTGFSAGSSVGEREVVFRSVDLTLFSSSEGCVNELEGELEADEPHP